MGGFLITSRSLLGAKAWAVLAIVASTSLLAWGYLNSQPHQAPDVTFTTLNGKRIALRELRGQPVMVTFWASTCAICLREAPHLARFYADLHSQGLEVIAVAMSYDPPNRVLETARQLKIPYPVALDLDGSLAQAFGNVEFTPTTFLVNENREIVLRKSGALEFEALRNTIDATTEHL